MTASRSPHSVDVDTKGVTMLLRVAGLDDAALTAIAGLERRVVAVDGGRLKLEWESLRARSGDRVEDLLWSVGDRLVGFLGLYAFGAPTVELAGMVVRTSGAGASAGPYWTARWSTPRTPSTSRARRPMALLTHGSGCGPRRPGTRAPSRP